MEGCVLKFFIYLLIGLAWLWTCIVFVISYPINLAITYFGYRARIMEGGIRVWRKSEKRDRFLEWKEIKEIE